MTTGLKNMRFVEQNWRVRELAYGCVMTYKQRKAEQSHTIVADTNVFRGGLALGECQIFCGRPSNKYGICSNRNTQLILRSIAMAWCTRALHCSPMPLNKHRKMRAIHLNITTVDTRTQLHPQQNPRNQIYGRTYESDKLNPMKVNICNRNPTLCGSSSEKTYKVPVQKSVSMQWEGTFERHSRNNSHHQSSDHKIWRLEKEYWITENCEVREKNPKRKCIESEKILKYAGKFPMSRAWQIHMRL